MRYDTRIMAQNIRSFFVGLDGNVAAYVLVATIAAVFIAGLLLSLLTRGCRGVRPLDNPEKSAPGKRKKNCRHHRPPVFEESRKYNNFPHGKYVKREKRACTVTGSPCTRPSKFFSVELAVSGFAAFSALAFFNDFALILTVSAGAAFSAAAGVFTIFNYKSAIKLCKKHMLRADALPANEKNAPASEEGAGEEGAGNEEADGEAEEACIFSDGEESEGGKTHAVELEENE